MEDEYDLALENFDEEKCDEVKHREDEEYNEEFEPKDEQISQIEGEEYDKEFEEEEEYEKELDHRDEGEDDEDVEHMEEEEYDDEIKHMEEEQHDKEVKNVDYEECEESVQHTEEKNSAEEVNQSDVEESDKDVENMEEEETDDELKPVDNFDLNDDGEEVEAVKLIDDHLNTDKHDHSLSNFKVLDEDSDIRIDDQKTADDSLEFGEEVEDFVEDMAEQYDGEVVEDNFSHQSGSEIIGMQTEFNTQMKYMVKNDDENCEEQEANEIDVTAVKLPSGIILERLDETLEEDKVVVHNKLENSSSSNTSLNDFCDTKKVADLVEKLKTVNSSISVSISSSRSIN